MGKYSALNITKIDDSFIGKYVECTIKGEIVLDALIIKVGHVYYLLQNSKNGSAPGLASGWREHGYNFSWTLLAGQLDDSNVEVQLLRIKNNYFLSPYYIRLLYQKNLEYDAYKRIDR